MKPDPPTVQHHPLLAQSRILELVQHISTGEVGGLGNAKPMRCISALPLSTPTLGAPALSGPSVWPYPGLRLCLLPWMYSIRPGRMPHRNFPEQPPASLTPTDRAPAWPPRALNRTGLRLLPCPEDSRPNLAASLTRVTVSSPVRGRVPSPWTADQTRLCTGMPDPRQAPSEGLENPADGVAVTALPT